MFSMLQQGKEKQKDLPVGFQVTCLWKVRNKGLPWVSEWDSRLRSTSCLWETSTADQSLDPFFFFFFWFICLQIISFLPLYCSPLKFFYENKISWRDLFFHPRSHKKEIVYTVQVCTVPPPYVKGSTGGWDTDSLRQLSSLLSWDL